MNIALFRLIAGFKRFREKYFLSNEIEQTYFQRLTTTGQTPKTLLIGCSDSRVDPAIMTGASPGELFVVRNVANLIPPCEPSTIGFHGTSSALEFAVVNLKVDNVIILGHRQCGGIRALMNGITANKESFIGQWMKIVSSVPEKVRCEHPHADQETQYRIAEMEALKISLQNVQSFPFVKEAIENRSLNVIAVYFDLEQGQLWEFDNQTSQFKQLEI
jgi:carbonic anhydrase